MHPDKNNTFCYFPFQQLALKSWQAGKGIRNFAPCCNAIRPEDLDPLKANHYFENDNKPTAKELFHSDEMNDLRQALLNGERHEACKVCWLMEDKNADNPSSYRLLSTPTADFSLDDPDLRSIDFMFGEECNLRCRMCSPGLSNKLRHDYRYFRKHNLDTTGIHDFEELPSDVPEYFYNDNDSHNIVYHFDEGEQWQDILDNIHDLRQIKATGGETTLAKPFKQFLDMAIEKDAAKNIDLQFHTNATKFTDSLIGKLRQFKSLSLDMSIDSYGKNYEYIRFPMTWSKLDKSIHNLLSKTQNDIGLIKNINFTIVMSALNAFNLTELLEYHKSLWNQYKHVESFVFYIDIVYPDNRYTTVKFLPPKLKHDLIEYLNNMNEYNFKQTTENNLDMDCTHFIEISNAINHVNSVKDYIPTEQDRLNMLREITVFDQSRNQDYHDYLDDRIIGYLDD